MVIKEEAEAMRRHARKVEAAKRMMGTAVRQWTAKKIVQKSGGRPSTGSGGAVCSLVGAIGNSNEFVASVAD